jgi:hypothetical protein
MYDYATQRPFVFTEEGQRTFLKVRDEAQRLCQLAGAVSCSHLMDAAAGSTGDSWDRLACIDRLVEIKELRRLTPVGSCSTSNEVFVWVGS